MTRWVFIQVDFHLFIHLSHCLSFTSSFPNVQFSPLAYDSNYSLIIEPTIILFPWLQKHYFCVLKLCLCIFIVHANSCEPLKSVSVIDQRQVEQQVGDMTICLHDDFSFDLSEKIGLGVNVMGGYGIASSEQELQMVVLLFKSNTFKSQGIQYSIFTKQMHKSEKQQCGQERRIASLKCEIDETSF